MKHHNYYDVLKAYQLLFSEQINITQDNLRGLKINSIKSAYKKMALKSHPDRAVLLGIHRNILEKKFKEVNEAYALLTSLVEKGGTSFPQGAQAKSWSGSRSYYGNNHGREDRKTSTKGNPFKKKRPRQQHEQSNERESHKRYNRNSEKEKREEPRPKSSADFMYRFFPREELLLGQFLYYSGRITLTHLIMAIQWQRGLRPPFGKIAMDWRILKHEDIITILKSRQPREKFGQCSLRLGMVSQFQYKAVLSKQKNLQRPIGEFFIHRGLLSKEDLDEMQKQLFAHNQQIRHWKNRQA